MDKQGLLSRDWERVKKGVVRGLSGKRSQYKQGMKVSNPECGNDKGFGLAGRKYMKGKQRKKDSGHKGLNTLLLALQMILMSWRVGICVDVSPTGLAMLCVEVPTVYWKLGKVHTGDSYQSLKQSYLECQSHLWIIQPTGGLAGKGSRVSGSCAQVTKLAH